MHSFKQMSSNTKKQLWGVFLHPHQFQPMTSLIVILSITPISSSLPQLSLGTCDCTLRIRTKLLWLRSHCHLLNYILPLCTTQGRMREKGGAPPIANCEQIALCSKRYTIEPVQTLEYNLYSHMLIGLPTWHLEDSCKFSGRILNHWYLKWRLIKAEVE